MRDRPQRGTERPAAMPAETEADAESSLPPGAHTKESTAPRGDVDQATPYEEWPAIRMHDQPFGDEPEGESGDDASDAARVDHDQ